MGMQTPREEPAQPLTRSAKNKIANQGYVSTGPDHAPQSRLPHIAHFLRSVAQDCPCERCGSYRETATMLDNPGSEY